MNILELKSKIDLLEDTGVDRNTGLIPKPVEDELNQLQDSLLREFTGGSLDTFLNNIETDALNFVPDVSTEKGRKVIISKAASITRNKTNIDKIGLDIVSSWKRKAKRVDVARKKSRDFLDALKNKVRQPVTEWEEVETKRKADEAMKIEIDRLHGEALAENILFDREKEVNIKLAAIKKAEDEQRQKDHDKEIAENARLAAENQAVEKRQKEIQAEKERQAAIELDRQKRESDTANREQIKKDIEEDIFKYIDESNISDIADAIINGKIRHVKVIF